MRIGPIFAFFTEDKRLFIYFRERHKISFEFAPRINCGLTFSQYDDRVTLMIAPILFALFISVTFPRRLVRAMEDHEIGFKFHGGCLWISPFQHTMHFSGKMPWWERGFCFHIVDWLIGEPKHSSKNLEERQMVINMPERPYIANVRMHLDSWKRRWYWPIDRIKRATIDVPEGIPIPGKGENSWDCGDDKRFGSTLPAEDPKDAVRKFISSIKQTREDRGGKDWWKKLLSKEVA